MIYLREIRVNQNYDPDKTALGGNWLDLGGFSNLVHARELEESIEIILGVLLEEDTVSDFLSDHERGELESAAFRLPEEWVVEVTDVSVCVSVRWSNLLDKPFVESFKTSINNQPFAGIRTSPDSKQVFLEQLDLSHPVLSGTVVEDDLDGETFEQRFSELIRPSVISLFQYEMILNGSLPLCITPPPFAHCTLCVQCT